MVNFVPKVFPIAFKAVLHTFGFNVKNPLNIPFSYSSAINPKGPNGPLVITAQTFANSVS